MEKASLVAEYQKNHDVKKRKTDNFRNTLVKKYTENQKNKSIAKAVSDLRKPELLIPEEYRGYLEAEDFAEKSAAPEISYGNYMNLLSGSDIGTVNDTSQAIYRNFWINGENGLVRYRNALGTGYFQNNEQYEYMEKEERDLYNYIFNTKGALAAESYLEEIKSGLRERQITDQSKQLARKADGGFFDKVGMSIGSVYNNFVGGIEGVVNAGRGLFGDGEVDPYPYYLTTAQLQREAVSDDFSNTGKFIYNTAMSGVDLIVAMLTTKGVGKLLGGSAKVSSTLSAGIVGSQAGAASLAEAKRRGYSDETAVALGIISGGVEWATEKWSIDALFDTKSVKRSARGFLKYIGKQAVVEGSEEATSEVLNYIADAAVTSVFGELDKSRAMEAYKKYISSGMSHNEAYGKVLLDLGGDALVSAAGGALLGVAIGSGNYALSGIGGKRAYSDEGRRIIEYEHSEDALFSAANASGDSGAVKIAKAAREAKSGSDEQYRKYGELSYKLHNLAVEQTDGAYGNIKLTEAQEKKLEEFYTTPFGSAMKDFGEWRELGESEYVKRGADVEETLRGGESLSANERYSGELLKAYEKGAESYEGSREAYDLYFELAYRLGKASEGKSLTGMIETLSRTDQKGIISLDNDTITAAFGAGVEYAEGVKARQSKIDEAVKAQKEKASEREDVKYSLSEEQVPVIELSDDSELIRLIENSDESKYKVIREYLISNFYGEVFTLSDGRKALMDKRDAQKLVYDADTRRTLQLENLKDVVEKAVYHSMASVEHKKFTEFYYYCARVKINEEIIPIWINVGKAKNDGKNHIYSITNKKEDGPANNDVTRPVGNAHNPSSVNSIPNSEEKVNSAEEKNESGDGERVAESSKFHIDKTIDRERLTETQKKGVADIERAAKLLPGFNFIVVDDATDAWNGMYDPKTRSIYVNIHAGRHSEFDFFDYALSEALSHEAVHGIKENAPVLFEELRAFMESEIFTGDSLELLAKRRMRQYSENGKALSYEDAVEEVIANSLENMLGKERVMAKLAVEHKSLFSRLWQLVRNFFKKLFGRTDKTGTFSKKTTESDIVKRASERKQKKLEDMFVKALRAASENAAALRVAGVSGSDTVKYSLETEERTPITADMTEEERYDVLRERSIRLSAITDSAKIAKIEGDFNVKQNNIEFSEYGDRKRLLMKIGEEFGIFHKYQNADVHLSFDFSRGNLKHSISSQKKNYANFIRLLSCLDEVINNAIGIEVHKSVTHKPDPTLDNMYVLASAFLDADNIIPVKLEIKRFSDKENTLYVAVALEGIKTDEVDTQGNTETGVTKQYARSSIISISQLFEKINPVDKSFLKYVPDGFLSREQKVAKQQAMLEDAEKDYKAAIKANNMILAQNIVDKEAKKKGYTIKSYHGTLAKDFTEFKKSFIGSRFNYDDKGFFFIDRKNIAEDYAKSEFDSKKEGRVLDVYLKVKKPLLVNKRFCLFEGLGNPFSDKDVIDVWDAYSEFFKEEAETRRCDGIIVDDGTSKMTVVFNSEQIKSADPITYDDNGNIIPLSERFNSRMTDIRYSLSDTLSREVLAEAFENIAETDAEREMVERYRSEIFSIGEMIDEKRKLEARYNELLGKKGLAGERSAINAKIRAYEDKIARRDERLLELSNAKPFKALVERYKSAAARKTARNTANSVTVSRGELAKKIASYTHERVYDRKDARMLLDRASGSNIRGAKREALIDEIWLGLNGCENEAERAEFIRTVSDKILDGVIAEANERNPQYENDAELSGYLKQYVGALEFSEDMKEEIKHKLDVNGSKVFFGRWGNKHSDRTPVPADVFVTDFARENPGYEYLETEHPADALFEIDALYERVSKTKKYVSKYDSVTKEERATMSEEIATLFTKTFREGGEISVPAREVVKAKASATEKAAALDKAKREFSKKYRETKDYYKATLALDRIARSIRDKKLGSFENATEIQGTELAGLLRDLSRFEYRKTFSPNEVRGKVKKLLSWYSKDNPMLGYESVSSTGEYVSGIEDMLKDLAFGEGAFTAAELYRLGDVLTYFVHFAEHYNKVWYNGKWEDAVEIAEQYIERMKLAESLKNNDTRRAGFSRFVRKYLDNYSDPLSVVRRYDSYLEDGFYTEMFRMLERSAVGIATSESRVLEAYYGFLKDNPDYLRQAQTEYVTVYGHKVPKLQAISVYMTTRQEHAQAGFVYNGFEYTDFSGHQKKVQNEVARASLEFFKLLHSKNGNVDSFDSTSLKSNAVSVSKMSAVSRLNGSEFSNDGITPLRERVVQFFESFGNSVKTLELGEVAVNKSSFRDDMAHGLTRNKVISFKAIPQVLASGRVIDVYKPEGKPYTRYTVAAPIEIGDKKYYMGVMVQKDNQSNRMYLHDIITEEATLSFNTEPTTRESEGIRDKGHLFITSILRNALKVNSETENTEDSVMLENSGLSPEEIKTIAEAHRAGMAESFSDKDKQLMRIVESAMSGELRSMKRDTDMQRLGFSNVFEGYYFPIYRSGVAKKIETEAYRDELTSVSNISANKERVKGSMQTLLAVDVTKVLTRHARAICTYANLQNSVDFYDKIFNVDVSGNKNRAVNLKAASERVWGTVKNAKGAAVEKSANDYFKELIEDIQGLRHSREGLVNEIIAPIRSGMVVAALGLNGKVLFSQLSSYGAAMHVLDFKALAKGIAKVTGRVKLGGAVLTEDGRRALAEFGAEVDKYCPLAKVRAEDNHAYLAQGVIEKKDGRVKTSRVSEAFSKIKETIMLPIGTVDRAVVCGLFEACKIQVESESGKAIGTAENLVAAGELLERVILDTQQNSLATEKSAAMRSESEIEKSLTMFSSDAMKTFGRFLDAWGELIVLRKRMAYESDTNVREKLRKRYSRVVKNVTKSSCVLFSNAIYMAAVGILFSLLRGKLDDEDDIWKSTLSDFSGNLIGGLPLIRDIHSLVLDGYDLSYYAFDVINDFAQGTSALVKTVGRLVSGEAELNDFMRTLKKCLFSFSQVVGVPLRNVYNAVYGFIKMVSKEAGEKVDDFFGNR